ncbi:hypothetical protein BE20_22485 [Sorangium cellulosum]|uniref:Uncharacterized protein n=1 Tax=Sorangium cellulosum TaxID=56 RepID=A0A150SBU7_SORCE|nr:hypothetical protein BE20_22485 [Sorangium cellulosum]KYF89881.1 hypothetical protein BE18_40160 [Sorangium cellulosum]
MRTSKTGRNSGRSTRGRGVVGGLAGLLGLGLCLGISSASAGDAAQASLQAHAHAQGRLGPQRASIGTQQAASTYVANPQKRRWIVAGASTLGGFWTASAIYGAALSLERPHSRLVPHCTKCACSLVRQRDSASASPTTLLIPLAGPWIHLGTGRHSAAGAVGLSVLGAGQAVGLGMLLGGIAMPRQVRVPMKRGSVLQVGAAPVVTPDGLGLSIHGSM